MKFLIYLALLMNIQEAEPLAVVVKDNMAVIKYQMETAAPALNLSRIVSWQKISIGYVIIQKRRLDGQISLLNSGLLMRHGRVPMMILPWILGTGPLTLIRLT
jgi:hypothetical protein